MMASRGTSRGINASCPRRAVGVDRHFCIVVNRAVRKLKQRFAVARILAVIWQLIGRSKGVQVMLRSWRALSLTKIYSVKRVFRLIRRLIAIRRSVQRGDGAQDIKPAMCLEIS